MEKSDGLVPESVSYLLGNDVIPAQSFLPERDRIRGNRETYRDHLPASAGASSRARPRKKSNDGAGAADVVAEIKMVAARVVEIDRAFDQTQAERLGVKIDVQLRISRDRGDVMDAGATHGDFGRRKGNAAHEFRDEFLRELRLSRDSKTVIIC